MNPEMRRLLHKLSAGRWVCEDELSRADRHRLQDLKKMGWIESWWDELTKKLFWWRIKPR